MFQENKVEPAGLLEVAQTFDETDTFLSPDWLTFRELPGLPDRVYKESVNSKVPFSISLNRDFSAIKDWSVISSVEILGHLSSMLWITLMGFTLKLFIL